MGSSDNIKSNGLDMVVWRYTENGDLDTDFVTGFGPVNPHNSSRRQGFISHHNAAEGGGNDLATDATLTIDNKIIVVGNSWGSGFNGKDFAVWRLTTEGKMDTTFGAEDKVNIGQRLGYITHHDAAGGGGHDAANGVLVSNNDEIRAVGSSYAGGTNVYDMAIWAVK